MRARHVVVVGAVLAALAGCAAEDPPATTPVPAPTAEIRTAGQRAYLAGLTKIDDGLTVNEDRAIRRAEETCADIKGGLKGADLNERVVERLSGGNATIDGGQAKQAVALMREHICSAG